jgi:hypothetical protein
VLALHAHASASAACVRPIGFMNSSSTRISPTVWLLGGDLKSRSVVGSSIIRSCLAAARTGVRRGARLQRFHLLPYGGGRHVQLVRGQLKLRCRAAASNARSALSGGRV